MFLMCLQSAPWMEIRYDKFKHGTFIVRYSQHNWKSWNIFSVREWYHIVMYKGQRQVICLSGMELVSQIENIW